jgi:hypothetical protein
MFIMKANPWSRFACLHVALQQQYVIMLYEVGLSGLQGLLATTEQWLTLTHLVLFIFLSVQQEAKGDHVSISSIHQRADLYP